MEEKCAHCEALMYEDHYDNNGDYIVSIKHEHLISDVEKEAA